MLEAFGEPELAVATQNVQALRKELQLAMGTKSEHESNGKLYYARKRRKRVYEKSRLRLLRLLRTLEAYQLVRIREPDTKKLLKGPKVPQDPATTECRKLARSEL